MSPTYLIYPYKIYTKEELIRNLSQGHMENHKLEIIKEQIIC